MSELTKGFEKYFPLPWHIKRRTVCWEMGVEENFIYLDLNGDSGRHASEVVPSLIDFTARRNNVEFNKYDVDNAREDALKYIVQCANLMPEAVEIIKLACFSPCRDLCKYAKDGAPSIDVPECDYCPEGAFYERAKKFLAKLEGGETA